MEQTAEYKVLGAIDIKDGSGTVQGQYRIGQVVNFPVSVGSLYVEQGLAELTEGSESEVDAVEESALTTEPTAIVDVNDETKTVSFDNGETAPLVTREEVVAELGEEKVSEIETPAVTSKTTEPVEQEVGEYKILEEVMLNDSQKGEYSPEIGEVITIPKVIGDQLVVDGTAEEVLG